MKAVDHSAKLGKLLDRLAAHAPATPANPADGAAPVDASEWPVLDDTQPILAEFLRSMLIWEAGVPAARVAAHRLASHIVDFNDLRVCLAEDLAALLGDVYPMAMERAERLRAALADLFRRTHAVSLEHLSTLSKREAKAYLDSLEGVPSFVAARVSLLNLGAHAMPVDRRTLARLVEHGAMPEDASPEDAADQIQRRVKAGELLPVYLALQAWVDEQPDTDPGPPGPPGPRARAKS